MNGLASRCGRLLPTALLLAALTALPVQAARGIPGSAEFAIGARFAPDSPSLATDIVFSQELQPDWLAVEVDWTHLQADPGSPPDWPALDAALEPLSAAGPALMLSVMNPPAWSLTGAGPDAQASAEWVAALAARYAQHIQAIELFPSPNTSAGWSDAPNPAAYFQVFQVVSARLVADGHAGLLLVSGGLEANLPADDPRAINDLDYLSALYAAGAAASMPVIGLRFSAVEGLPSAPPAQPSGNVLRHYELVRQLMTANDHAAGILWLTYLAFPGGTSTVDRIEWLAEAYRQIRAQLYIGAAFLQGINTCPAGDCGEVSLLDPAGSRHLFVPILRGFIARNAPPAAQRPGRAKSAVLRKPR